MNCVHWGGVGWAVGVGEGSGPGWIAVVGLGQGFQKIKFPKGLGL